MDQTRTSLVRRKEEKSIDFLFEEIVGPAGWAQWRAFLAYGPITICSIMPITILGHAIFVPRHRCFVPGCENRNASLEFLNWSIINSSIPKNWTSSAMLRQDDMFDSCRMFER